VRPDWLKNWTAHRSGSGECAQRDPPLGPSRAVLLLPRIRDTGSWRQTWGKLARKVDKVPEGDLAKDVGIGAAGTRAPCGQTELRKDMGDIVRAALAAVAPEACISRTVRLRGKHIVFGNQQLPSRKACRVLVLGMGKASAGMAAALEGVLGDRISAGIVAIADGYAVPTKRVEVVQAGHPVPDSRSVEAAKRMSRLAETARTGDLVLALVSGGGSSLAVLPPEPLTLSDVVRTNELLLRSGVRVSEMNVVRKHLCSLKGGRLAELASPAQVVGLVLSDVPGDPLGSIASGPTVSGPTAFTEALQIVRRPGLESRVPNALSRIWKPEHVVRGVRAGKPATRRLGR